MLDRSPVSLPSPSRAATAAIHRPRTRPSRTDAAFSARALTLSRRHRRHPPASHGASRARTRPSLLLGAGGCRGPLSSSGRRDSEVWVSTTLARHIAAGRPITISTSSLPWAILYRKRDVPLLLFPRPFDVLLLLGVE